MFFYALFLGWMAEGRTGEMRKKLSGRRTTIDLGLMLANGMPTCRAEEISPSDSATRMDGWLENGFGQ